MTNEAKAAAMTTAPDEEPRGPLKRERLLSLLLAAYEAGRWLTHEDTHAAYGDSCFPTDVSGLRQAGLTIEGERHRFTNCDGRPTTRNRYRLADAESVEKARKLRDTYRRARGALPANPEEGRRHA